MITSIPGIRLIRKSKLNSQLRHTTAHAQLRCGVALKDVVMSIMQSDDTSFLLMKDRLQTF